MDKIDQFIAELAKEESTSKLTNVYSPMEVQSEICRHNLSLYLHRVIENNSKVMLVGEAPGYHGCRLSGIAFTCEYDYTIDVIPGLIGKGLGYKIFSEDKPEYELSASIVWPKLQEWYKLSHTTPMLWNICPFHPHAEGNVMSNRTPTTKKVQRGVRHFMALLEMFDIKHIGCIGKKSDMMVEQLGLPHTYLRHPSCGGINKFRTMIDEFRERIAK